MTPQQKRFSADNPSRLAVYRDLMVGEKGWGALLGFELYHLLALGLGSLGGVCLRSALLPLFCRSFGKGSIIGKGVTIRQPYRISIGRSVIIDDYAVLDVRSPHIPNEEVGIEIDDHAMIGRGSIVSTKGGFIRLGRAVNISSNCRVATRSRIEIGDSVLIAAYVYIGCGNHSFTDATQPIMEQGMIVKGGVSIGANSWIGTRATILDGVTIGENAVVGAHSLVKDDVPANAIVAGTPARLIRMRGEAGAG